MPEPIRIAIMADGVKYTAMADLLASSIHFFHASRQDVRLVIGVPEDAPSGLVLRERSWAEIADFVILPTPSLLDSRTQKPYRHINKILLLEEATRQWPAAHQLMLDSDLVLLRALPLTFLASHRIAAMPVHYYSWSGNWERLYSQAGVRTNYLTISSSGYEVGPPYFNAGVVWVHQRTASRLNWSSMLLKIHAAHHLDPSMHLFPWLDQLALPLAASHCGERIGELPDCLNMLCDKLLRLSEVARSAKSSSFIPHIPFLVHHHGDVPGLAQAIEQCNQSLHEHQSCREAMDRLMQLHTNGEIQRHQARVKQN